MKASECMPGMEQHENFKSSMGKKLVQYDYRAYNGKLFSCVKSNLTLCRAARDKWVLAQDGEV